MGIGALMAGRTVQAPVENQKRRRVHGGESQVWYSRAIETAEVSGGRASGTRRWRSTLLGALIGLLVVLVLLMKWLVGFQVEAAAERRTKEAGTRAELARCFELASQHPIETCRTGKDAEANLDPRLIKSDQS
jgi:hypothetical protein